MSSVVPLAGAAIEPPGSPTFHTSREPRHAPLHEHHDHEDYHRGGSWSGRAHNGLRHAFALSDARRSVRDVTSLPRVRGARRGPRAHRLRRTGASTSLRWRSSVRQSCCFVNSGSGVRIPPPAPRRRASIHSLTWLNRQSARPVLERLGVRLAQGSRADCCLKIEE